MNRASGTSGTTAKGERGEEKEGGAQKDSEK